MVSNHGILLYEIENHPGYAAYDTRFWSYFGCHGWYVIELGDSTLVDEDCIPQTISH